MLAQISTWIMVAMLGQPAPADLSPAWLKSIPADVDLVVRSRGLESTHADLIAMLNAMTPRGAQQAAPALSNLLAQFEQQHGAEAVKTPWVSLIRVVAPGPDGAIPFAVLVMQEDYQKTLKALAGGRDVALKPEEGGFDSFDNPHGDGSWYAVKGAGFVAFGPDKSLIAAVAKPGPKSLDQAFTPALARSFLAGDLGLFVNAAQLSTRYADLIAQGRQTLMAGFDQAAQQNPGGPSMEAVKKMYGRLFDSIKDASVLALSFDVAAEGLHVAAQLDAKPDSDLAKSVAAQELGSDDLGNFPADSVFYVSVNMDAKDLESWQSLSFGTLSPGGTLSPEMKKALESYRTLGRIRTSGSASFVKGMRGFNVVNTSDPKAYVDMTNKMIKSMQGGDNPLNLYKDVKVEPNAQTYQGVSFAHVVGTMDVDKLEKLAGGNQAGGGAAGVKAMFQDGRFEYWIGSDDKRVFQLMTPDWEQGKAQLETFLKGDHRINTVPGFRAVRSALADQASVLMIANAQGLVRMIASQFGANLNRPELKEPAGLPAEPAFLGFSLTPRQPAGFEFHFALPSSVVPVLENGLIPLIQQAQPAKVNQ